MPKASLEERILRLVNSASGKPLSRREITERLVLRGAEKKKLTGCLKYLVDKKRISKKEGCYRKIEREPLLQGIFSKHERGFGFVRFEDENREDLFIAEKHAGTVMNGDRVSARHLGFDRSGRPFGKIVKVVQRTHKFAIGILQHKRKRVWVQLFDKNIVPTVYVTDDQFPPEAIGQVVKVEFVLYPTATSAASGRIVEVLGGPEDPKVDIETIVQKYNLPKDFSPSALFEAEQVSIQPIEAGLKGRIDLRNLSVFTIDGETARDFDDAVSVRKESEDHYRLWVCIADVAHYVLEGGEIDSAALERGTSVYFPGYCLPMLPKQLSEDVCSLKPGVDRLAMVAELVFDSAGSRISEEFYPAVMCSRARLTYTQVAELVSGESNSEVPDEVFSQLKPMVALSGLLRDKCIKGGRLELDIKEVEVIIDEDGYPVDAVHLKRTIAHQLIEEFMLAANEAVASFLEKESREFLYRVHEPPSRDNLLDLQQLAATTGNGFVIGRDLQRELQKLLKQVSDIPESGLIHQQLLRSLQQARYSPEKKGHFGLGVQSYCHFTSPIRRYPDLQVHRALKKVIYKWQQDAGIYRELIKLGELCSEKERRAMKAERELIELRRCQLLKNRVGDRFDGKIVSVTEFGFFVELDNMCVEGLVHVRSMVGDYYNFDPTTKVLLGERRRSVFKVGMAVKIRVENVDLWRKRINFVLVDDI